MMIDGNEAQTSVIAQHTTGEQFVRTIDSRLRAYGGSRHGNKDNPIDELIFIILSAQTEAYSFQNTYDALASAFPSLEELLDTPEEDIAAIIKTGGLAKKKANQIKGALTKIVADFGALSLDQLTTMDDASAEAYLTSLPGIGVKSAKCILLYSLRRPVFPVDTHVWRICRRLDLAPAVPKPTGGMARALERRIPPDIRYSLHVNMVSHGRATCLTYWPHCDKCVLADDCPSAFKQDFVWGNWRKPRGAWARAVAIAPPTVNDRDCEEIASISLNPGRLPMAGDDGIEREL
jgi:endonuclease III